MPRPLMALECLPKAYIDLETVIHAFPSIQRKGNVESEGTDGRIVPESQTRSRFPLPLRRPAFLTVGRCER